MIDLPVYLIDEWKQKWVICPICRGKLKIDRAANHFYKIGKRDPAHKEWATSHLTAKNVVKRVKSWCACGNAKFLDMEVCMDCKALEIQAVNSAQHKIAQEREHELC